MSKQITIRVEAVGSGAVLCPRIVVPMNAMTKDVVFAIESKIGPATCFLPDASDPCSIGTKMDFMSETFFPIPANQTQVVSVYRICPECDAEVTTSISSGHLECLKYHFLHGQSVTEDLFEVAVEHGRLDCLTYLGGKICSLYEVVMLSEIAIEHNHVDCLKYVYEHGCSIDQWMVELAAELGHLECLTYISTIMKGGLGFDRDTLVAAIMHDHQLCLEFMVTHGAEIPDEVGIICLKKSLGCLKILYQHGFRSEFLHTHAARLGKVKALEFLHGIGCVWDQIATNNAAQYGHLDCLRYIHETGGDFTETTISLAAQYGHFECLVYLHENHCPSNRSLLRHVVRKGDMKMLEYLHQTGYPWDTVITAEAMEYGQLEVLRYLFKYGCPFNYISEQQLNRLPLAAAEYYRTVVLKKSKDPSTPTKRKKPM